MNFDLNAKRKANHGQAPSTAGYASTPSVPISVYRELAAELQATQTLLDSAHSQNQYLHKANRRMQVELDQITESAHKLQQIAGKVAGLNSPPQDAAAAPSPAQPLSKEAPAVRRPPQSQSARPPMPQGRKAAVESLNQLLRDRPARPRPLLSTGQSGEISTWWLMAMIIFIVVTAFGTGFILVRPFLNPSSSTPVQPGPEPNPTFEPNPGGSSTLSNPTPARSSGSREEGDGDVER